MNPYCWQKECVIIVRFHPRVISNVKDGILCPPVDDVGTPCSPVDNVKSQEVCSVPYVRVRLIQSVHVPSQHVRVVQVNIEDHAEDSDNAVYLLNGNPTWEDEGLYVLDGLLKSVNDQ